MSNTYTSRSTPDSGSPQSSSPQPARKVARWRTVDLITTVMLGLAFGVIFIGWAQVGNVTKPLFTALPPLSGLLNGVFWLPAVVAMVIIRRPGAALLAELIAASVEPLLGSQWGLSTLVSGLIQGAGVELGFLLFAYRRWGAWPAVVGGLLAGLFETPYDWKSYYTTWTAGYAGIYGVAQMISGAILAGLLGLALAKALAATGALGPFPIARERAETRRI